MTKKWNTPELTRFGSFAEMTENSETGCPEGPPPGKTLLPGDDSCMNTTCAGGNCEDGGGGVLS